MPRRVPPGALEGGTAAAAAEGGRGGGGGWGGEVVAGVSGVGEAAAATGRRPRGGTTWEAGPFSASYDWRQFPNRIKVIKRVLALPLLDVQAFCWLDPRAAIAAASTSSSSRRRQPQAPPPRLFLASDDSFDSSAAEDADDVGGGWEAVGGGEPPGGSGARRRRQRRQQQHRKHQQHPARQAAEAAAAALGFAGPRRPTPSRPWFGTGAACRDRVLQGLITLDPASRTLDYSKALPVSLGGGALVLVLGASWKVGSSIVPGQPAWRPALRVGLTTAALQRGGRGAAAASSRRPGGAGRGRGGVDGDGDGAGDTTRASATIRGSPLGLVHVRQTAFLDRRLGVEVVGDLSARLRPAAAQRARASAAESGFFEDAAGGAGAGAAATLPLSPDMLFDSLVLHADVSEMNLVWRL